MNRTTLSICLLAVFMQTAPCFAVSPQDTTITAVDSVSEIREEIELPIEIKNKEAEKKEQQQLNNSETDVKRTEPKENESSNTANWIAGFSALIALIAIVLSIINFKKTSALANKDFFLTHRPFVWVENFGYLDANNKVVSPINKVMIRVINSPAKFTSERFEYYIIDENNQKTDVETQENKGLIRYPDDKSQYTNTCSKVTDQVANSLQPNQELQRIVRIEYSWLSSDKNYVYEAKWQLDKTHKNWQSIEQSAD